MDVLSTHKDVTDLQNFVNVALATAAGGEGDFAHDRLSNLRTVGSGFGSLIYNLSEDAGYHDLSKRCIPLWDALQNNPLLPQKLVRICNATRCIVLQQLLSSIKKL